MSKEVKILVMTPEFVQDADPRYVGEAVARTIEGGAFGVILIGSREDAQRFTELNLWQFAPPEEASAV